MHHTGTRVGFEPMPAANCYCMRWHYLVTVGTLILCLSVHAQATTYYVASAGNDAYAGTSPDSAWATLQRVCVHKLHPADTVRLMSGDTLRGSLSLDQDDGNDASNPVVVTSTSDAPAIIAAGDANGIVVYNTQGIHISNLVIIGSGMDANGKSGIEVYADTPGDVQYRNLMFQNLDISFFGQAGLRIGTWIGNTGFSGILIEHVTVHHNRAEGIQVYGYHSVVGHPHSDIVVRYCVTHHNPGYADTSTHHGSGIMIGNTDGVLIEYCTAYFNGYGNTHCGGPGGIWVYKVNNTIIQYCESHHNSAGSGCDGIGFDLDGAVTNSVIQYCYSHNNDGAGFLLGQYEGAMAWYSNTCRYNISVNDGRTNHG